MKGVLRRGVIALGGLYLLALVALWAAWIYVVRGEAAFEAWFDKIIEEGMRP